MLRIEYLFGSPALIVWMVFDCVNKEAARDAEQYSSVIHPDGQHGLRPFRHGSHAHTSSFHGLMSLPGGRNPPIISSLVKYSFSTSTKN